LAAADRSPTFHVAPWTLPSEVPPRKTAVTHALVAHIHSARDKHAHSCLRSGQPASQNAFCRIECPQDPKSLRVRIEVSLRWVYSLLRILFTSPENVRARQRHDRSGLASPHLPPASINGTFGVTAWIRLTDFLQPTLFSFQKTSTRRLALLPA
jgi:hypothetical protein